MNLDCTARASDSRSMASLGWPTFADDPASSLILNLPPVDWAAMVEAAKTVEPFESDVWERPSVTG